MLQIVRRGARVGRTLRHRRVVVVLLQAVQASHQNLKNQNLSDQHGERSDTSKHVILTDGLRDVARADRVAPAAGN